MLADTIVIGESYSSVQEKFKTALAKHRDWQLSEEARGDGMVMCSVDTPLEVGAKNWVLYISFGSNRVESVAVRTADSEHYRPSDAPGDRIR